MARTGTLPLKPKDHTPYMNCNNKRKVTAATETPTARKTPKVAVAPPLVLPPQVFPPRFPPLPKATMPNTKATATGTMANGPWNYYCSSQRNSVPVPYLGPTAESSGPRRSFPYMGPTAESTGPRRPIPYMGVTAEKSGPRHLSGSVKRKEAPQYQHLMKDDDEFFDEFGSECGSQLSASVKSKEHSQYENFDDEIFDDFEPEASDKSDSLGLSLSRRGGDGGFVSDNMEEGHKKKKRDEDEVENESYYDNGSYESERQRIMHVGPKDTSIIPSFVGHVAYLLQEGEDRKVLKCHNQVRACNTLQAWREELSDEVKACLDATKLGHLPWSMFSEVDFPLISAFVERWQPDTNTFHLPFGEMTIMLHDVVQILRIPVEGHMVSAQYSEDSLKFCIRELFGGIGLDNSPHFTEGGVPVDSIDKLCKLADPPRHKDTLMTAYIFLALGCTLFVDKNGCKVRPCDVVEAKDFPDKIGDYSWGSATLAYLYRQLGIASRSDCRDIAGCLTLFQAWIYEYFPAFRPHQQRNIIQPGYPRSCMWNVRWTDKGEHRLHSIRRQLDKMTASEVEWLPYGPDPYKEVPRTLLMPGFLRYRDIIEPYLPDRVIRQLGYIQEIPLDIPKPVRAFRPKTSAEYEVEYDTTQAEWIWRAFPRVGRLNLSELKPFSDGFTDGFEYMFWFTNKSRPCILNERIQESETPARLAHWKKTMMSIMEPIYKARDQMPNMETKNACTRWEIFRYLCKSDQNPT